MERGSLLQVAIFVVLISLSYSAPIEDEDDAGVAERKPLLEKLGMELYRWFDFFLLYTFREKLCLGTFSYIGFVAFIDDS